MRCPQPPTVTTLHEKNTLWTSRNSFTESGKSLKPTVVPDFAEDHCDKIAATAVSTSSGSCFPWSFSGILPCATLELVNFSIKSYPKNGQTIVSGRWSTQVWCYKNWTFSMRTAPKRRNRSITKSCGDAKLELFPGARPPIRLLQADTT